MTESAIHWCPKRTGGHIPKGCTSFFWNHWRGNLSLPCVIAFKTSEKNFTLSGDNEIDIHFEILGGSDASQFRLELHHVPSDKKSFLSFPAWSSTDLAAPRKRVEYPNTPPPSFHTFSTYLKNVLFLKLPEFPSSIQALTTWSYSPRTYPVKLQWESEEPPIAINMSLKTDSWGELSKSKYDIWRQLNQAPIAVKLALKGGPSLAESWSFFHSQPSPTLPPRWRYAKSILENQHTVGELPYIYPQSEIVQFHQRFGQIQGDGAHDLS